MSGWRAIFGGKRARREAKYERWVRDISALEPELVPLSDEAITERARSLRAQAARSVPLDELLVPTFALVREAGKRALGLRHFDVQLVGGMALHEGLVAEMKTGEGKTLVATLAAALNAFTGRGVHVVTVNDYLAQRDAEWMGPLYRMLGLTVGVILEDMGDDFDEELARRQAAYACDITYGTNHEIAFDYLRDNLAMEKGEIVQRGHAYAIVDEVDFLLIDEARTPLIISGESDLDLAELFARVDACVRNLREVEHYVVERKTQTASLTEAGVDAIQSALGVTNLAAPEHLDIFHAVFQSVLAHGAYERDVDYVVEDGDVYIVDEFTGRISEDKRYADGLHQAIEAKEKVEVRPEDQTIAKVTYQTFFGRYDKLAGMTGTAWSEREELMRTYGRDVHVVPTNRPMIRDDDRDLVFDTLDDKHQAVLEAVQRLRAAGRPVLVGTTSVRESEKLSRHLEAAGVEHALLNAKNHRAEAQVIAQAGRARAVTISTNMAGRGTDIILGGNAEMMVAVDQSLAGRLEALRAQCAEERAAIVAAGGLHVIGTARHESERIDDQLRGRSGRQGDPGSSQFFLSLDDPLWKKFGKDAIAEIKAQLRDAGHPAGQAIEDLKIRRTLRALQKKVEVENEGIRRDVLKYDLVVHAQRESIYAWRRSLLEEGGFDAHGLIRALIEDLVSALVSPSELIEALSAHFGAPFELPEDERVDRIGIIETQAHALLEERERIFGEDAVRALGRQMLLTSIDALWTEHLSHLERLEEGIGLRGYADADPVVAFRREAGLMWQELAKQIKSRAVRLWFLVDLSESERVD